MDWTQIYDIGKTVFAIGGAVVTALGLGATFMPNSMLEMVLAKFWRWVFSKVPNPIENSILGFLALALKVGKEVQKEPEAAGVPNG